MNVAEVLAKRGIKKEQWEIFINIAQANVRPPEREKGQKKDKYKKELREWMRTAPAWAYVGGMRDALWAWVGADRDSYDVLEKELTKAAQKRLDSCTKD